MFSLNQSFLERWGMVLQRKAAAPAVLDASGGMLATFAEIEQQSGVWAARLSKFPARSVIGIQLGNHADWPAILLAIWRADQVALPLDASLRTEPTQQILQTASAAALISENGMQMLTFPLGRAMEMAPSTVLCKVTSGTTATPRLIQFSDAQLLADADNICQTMGLRESDINYGAIPFSHSYGFSNLLTPLLTRGIPLVVARDNFPRAMMEGLTKSRATVLPGVPVLFQSLARLDLVLPPSVRLCVTASAPLSSELARDFFARNGRKVHSFYGASECGGICYDGSDEIDLPEGFVGKPLCGVQLEHSCDTGRIVVRGRAVGDGYFPAERHDSLIDGTFRPADVLQKVNDGFRIVGRISDFVNITGKKLNPQTVETVIEKIAGVTRAVVCGVPHARRGELAVAVVEARQVSREDVFSACRKVLAPWQVPSDVWLLDELPTLERGKTIRRELAQAYLARELVGKT